MTEANASNDILHKPQWLLSLACIVIVVAALRELRPIMLPILVAMLFAIVAIPPMRWLERRGAPSWLSILAVVAGAAIAALFVTSVAASSINRFSSNVALYSAHLNNVIADGLSWLDGLGLDIETMELASQLDGGALFRLMSRTAGGILAILSQSFLVLLLLIFMLLEAHGFAGKLRLALGTPDADLHRLSAAADQVYDYLFLKALVSGATGILVSILTWACRIDFPLLWGLLAFLFNFVPNIGSIIAAVPATLLALLQHGLGLAIGVGVGYLIINLVIGNAIEPKLMGNRLGLSTLVVFLSLLFWGWLWGPVGMLLSVPLTVIVKLVLDDSEQFRTIGALLGPNPN